MIQSSSVEWKLNNYLWQYSNSNAYILIGSPVYKCAVEVKVPTV